jgi:hypothetical protein
MASNFILSENNIPFPLVGLLHQRICTCNNARLFGDRTFSFKDGFNDGEGEL